MNENNRMENESAAAMKTPAVAAGLLVALLWAAPARRITAHRTLDAHLPGASELRAILRC